MADSTADLSTDKDNKPEQQQDQPSKEILMEPVSVAAADVMENSGTDEKLPPSNVRRLKSNTI